MDQTCASVNEPARDVPVLADYDVVVCGGGPAGCAAAIASARLGARTLLVEKYGYLGGAAVAQLVCTVHSTNGADLQGIWHEFMSGLLRRGAVRPFTAQRIDTTFDPEQTKYVWDELLSAAGADLLHHVHAAGAVVEQGAVRGVFAETCAGRRAILGRRVIDCTGDGMVAAAAGVPCEQGDGTTPWGMALSKVFRLGNAQWPEADPDPTTVRRVEKEWAEAVARGEFTLPELASTREIAAKLRVRYGALPDYRREVRCMHHARIYRVNPLDPWDLTRAEREGREQARQTAQAYCRYMPGFESAYLLDTSHMVGLRASRRLRGLATATAEDVKWLRKYPDGIARCSWPVDIWPADKNQARSSFSSTPEFPAWRDKLLAGDYYDIRYGCLVAQGVDNLLMAGRCVSCDFEAQASLRIQQTCMATGQAAGAVAALSLAAGTVPRLLDPRLVVEQLKKDRAAVAPAFDMRRIQG